MVLLGDGFNESRLVPAPPLTAASLILEEPPTTLNEPPTNTVSFLAAMAFTVEFAEGFHELRFPLLVLKEAR